MTSVRYATRRPAAAVLAVLLTATVLVGATTAATAQSSSPEFSDLDQTLHADAIRLVAEDGITRGYPDGTFRPRDDVRRDQMASFLRAALQLEPRASDFPDVPPESVHAEAIGAIAHADVTRGFPDGTYRPLGFVTRGQMATFLAKGLDLAPGDATFSDVPAEYVHADAIAALADSGITEGYPDGTFRPNVLVKRDQMAAFLARGIPLPREVEVVCPPDARSLAGTSATTTSAPSTHSGDEADEGGSVASDRGSEDLEAMTFGAEAVDRAGEAASALATEDLGPAIPATTFPVTAASRTAGAWELHSQDQPTSRSARVPDDPNVDVTSVATKPGQRTWATAVIGSNVYTGNWGIPNGQTNLFRYSATATGERTVAHEAWIRSGGEFWTLAPQGNRRLWGGTRFHASGENRRTIGLATRGYDDPRHVVHRIDLASNGRVDTVHDVIFGAPCLPTLESGLRPDVKQIASVGDTVYVGLGQQSNGARLYAFEPGNRREIPIEDVRHITPDSVTSATGIFAMEADDRHLVLGTQSGADVPARLVVIDTRDDAVRFDAPLPDELRVDAVAIDGNRVVASANSGQLYRATIPGSGTGTTVTALGSPVPDGQFSRAVEFDGNALRGVSNQGLLWRRSTSTSSGSITTSDAIDRGAPGYPGQPQSLHAGAGHLAVGGSNVVLLRPADAPGTAPTRVTIAGEAKALTSSPDGSATFAATYPSARLVRITGGTATELAEWDSDYLRPADAAYDARSDRVQVIARDDNEPMSHQIGSDSMQFRASNLFALEADGTTPDERLEGWPLHGEGEGGNEGTSERNPDGLVEAGAVAVAPGDTGTTVLVGDTFGGIQAVDSATGDRVGEYRVLTDPGTQTRRPVIDIDTVGDRVIVTTSGTPFGRSDDEQRTAVHELDAADLTPARTARLLDTWVTGSTRVTKVGDAVSTGENTLLVYRGYLLELHRTTGTLQLLETHDYDVVDAFGGPYLALSPDCELYGFDERNLFRRDYDSGGCGLLGGG